MNMQNVQNIGRRKYKYNHLPPQCDLSNLQLGAGAATKVIMFKRKEQMGCGLP